MCVRSVSENPIVVFQSSPSATNFCPDLRLLGLFDNGQIFGALLQVVQLLIPIEKWQWGYNGLLGAFVEISSPLVIGCNWDLCRIATLLSQQDHLSSIRMEVSLLLMG